MRLHEISPIVTEGFQRATAPWNCMTFRAIRGGSLLRAEAPPVHGKEILSLISCQREGAPLGSRCRMSKIVIQRHHKLSPHEVRGHAESLARRIEERWSVSWHWAGNRLTLVAPSGPAHGASGVVTVAPSSVCVEIHLPLMLSPVRSLVESKVRSKLDAVLGPA